MLGRAAVGLEFRLAFGGKLLGLLDDLFLVALATKLGDDLPATAGTWGEFNDGFGQQSDVFFRPITVFDRDHFILLLLCCLRCRNISR